MKVKAFFATQVGRIVAIALMAIAMSPVVVTVAGRFQHRAEAAAPSLEYSFPYELGKEYSLLWDKTGKKIAIIIRDNVPDGDERELITKGLRSEPEPSGTVTIVDGLNQRPTGEPVPEEAFVSFYDEANLLPTRSLVGGGIRLVKLGERQWIAQDTSTGKILWKLNGWSAPRQPSAAGVVVFCSYEGFKSQPRHLVISRNGAKKEIPTNYHNAKMAWSPDGLKAAILEESVIETPIMIGANESPATTFLKVKVLDFSNL